MTPDEARERITNAWPSSGDAIYAYRTGTAPVELRSAKVVSGAIGRDGQFLIGEPGITIKSILDVPAGELVSLDLPLLTEDALVMAEISLKWDPDHPRSMAHIDRFKRWRAVFRKGLRGGTRWRFLGYRDTPPEERATTELFSDGALAFHRAGGRWVQRWVPHQEWDPPPSGRL